MRYILIILVFLSVGANAQMVIKAHANYRPYASPAANLLLDDYPNAAAAYSLRKLRTAYSGAAIRVRRSNDNAEQDIGFDGSGNLDETALIAFVGANSAFVTTWYDQSGNGRNTIQSTQANQPRIVNTGVIDRVNSKPAVLFDGTNDALDASASGAYFAFLHSPGQSSVYIVTQPSLLSGQKVMLSTTRLSQERGVQLNFSGTSAQHLIGTSTNIAVSNTSAGGYASINTQYLLSFYGNPDNATASLRSTIEKNNGNAVNNNTSTVFPSTGSSGRDFRLGDRAAGGQAFNGYLQEIVIYNSGQSSNKSGISGNINIYYAIY